MRRDTEMPAEEDATIVVVDSAPQTIDADTFGSVFRTEPQS